MQFLEGDVLFQYVSRKDKPGRTVCNAVVDYQEGLLLASDMQFDNSSGGPQGKFPERPKNIPGRTSSLCTKRSPAKLGKATEESNETDESKTCKT